jgi:type II secretory pathway pseudopilin PulG
MAAARVRGFSLVETLVGLAVGLLVTATALALVLGHVREYRAAWIQSRVTQDLRDAADAVERDLRRAGHWRDATTAAWSAGAASAANPHAALVPAAAPLDAVRFSYSNDDGDEAIGFRLHDGVVEMRLGSGRWQALTDGGTVTVTAFSLVPTQHDIPLQALCARAGGGAPALSMRSVQVAIRGHAAGDPRIVRSVQGLVHLPNHVVAGDCPR